VIQIDGIKIHVFLKFVYDIYIQNTLQSTNGGAEYRHVSGEISIVRLEVTGMGMRRIRIANLPPEVTERSIRAALASYGETVSIQDEIWLKAYRYKVANGVKVIMMKLAKHLPSQMNIAGHRALPSYDGQPVTYYGCGDSGHMNQKCPRRRGGGMVTSDSTPNTGAHVAAKGAHNQHGIVDNRIEVVPQSASHDQTSGVSPNVDDLKPTNAPLDTDGEKQDCTHKRRHDLTPQVEDTNLVNFTTCTDPQEVIIVEEVMTAFDDRPTTQTARPLHANTQGEEGTRQEMATDVGNTDGLDEDAVPADGATNPPGQTPPRNKEIKLDKSAGIRREWTSRTRVAQPNKVQV